MTSPLDTNEDTKLLAEISKGSHGAFAALVRKYSTRFYAVAYRFLGSRQDAEDIVQEAFLKLWERPDMWSPDRNIKFTTWFYRVITNACLDLRKRKSALPMAEDMEFADERSSQEELLGNYEAATLLEGAINALPARQQVALNLCFYEELSNQDAADIMGVNIKALQSLLMRAKSTLKGKFQEAVL